MIMIDFYFVLFTGFCFNNWGIVFIKNKQLMLCFFYSNELFTLLKMCVSHQYSYCNIRLSKFSFR